jgi:hypothetical protein
MAVRRGAELTASTCFSQRSEALAQARPTVQEYLTYAQRGLFHRRRVSLDRIGHNPGAAGCV